MLHRPLDQPAVIPVMRVGIATTDALRTLGDLGQVVFPDQLSTVVFGLSSDTKAELPRGGQRPAHVA